MRRPNPFLLLMTLLVAALPAALAAQAGRTTVTADRMDLVGTVDRNYFTYEGNVRVESTNLTVEADRLEMIGRRRAEAAGGAVGEVGAIESIVATGNVVIRQEGRTARAGRAEVLPDEGKLVLTENPSVEVSGATVTGWRITLVQGERRAYVEASPFDRSVRPTVTAEALPDLGFDADAPPTPAPAPAPAPAAPEARP